jgi:acid phosphatase family membrane protein YuiD
MHVLQILISSKILIAAALSWMLAQLIKTILTMISSKRFVSERLFGAGGMPSAHSAAVCALTWGVERQCGLQLPDFALSVIFSFVVMYDAMSVRRAIGEHAKLLNKIVVTKENERQDNCEKGLKEHQGHTPLEVDLVPNSVEFQKS